MSMTNGEWQGGLKKAMEARNEQLTRARTVRDEFSQVKNNFGQLPTDDREKQWLAELASTVTGPDGNVGQTVRRLLFQRERARRLPDWTVITQEDPNS